MLHLDIQQHLKLGFVGCFATKPFYNGLLICSSHLSLLNLSNLNEREINLPTITGICINSLAKSTSLLAIMQLHSMKNVILIR